MLAFDFCSGIFWKIGKTIEKNRSYQLQFSLNDLYQHKFGKKAVECR